MMDETDRTYRTSAKPGGVEAEPKSVSETYFLVAVAANGEAAYLDDVQACTFSRDWRQARRFESAASAARAATLLEPNQRPEIVEVLVHMAWLPPKRMRDAAAEVAERYWPVRPGSAR